MCILLYKSLGKKLDKDIYHNCFINNDDGAGYAWIKDGELFTGKGFFTFNEFWENFAPLEEYASIIHFRVGSSGYSAGENCHPWRVSRNLVFGHNGIIPIDRKSLQWSDTGNFCEYILKPLTKSFPEWWQQKEFKWMMEVALGATNKMVLLDKDGHHQIFNENKGEWNDEVWYSNNTYLAKKQFDYYNTECGFNRFQGSQTQLMPHQMPKTKVTQTKQEEFSELHAKIDVKNLDLKLEEAEKRRLKDLEK